MLIRLAGAAVHDPVHGVDGAVQDLYMEDGRIVAPPSDPGAARQTVDCSGFVIMAGAIDLHTHIGGGKMNIARMLMGDDHRMHPFEADALQRQGVGGASPSSFTTGYRYAEMGYTACFEPSMQPVNARHAHTEMADIPMVDRGAYAMLGNDDLMMTMLAHGEDQKRIDDYVAWTIRATQAIGIKVVNPGGISAFKFNQRSLDVDEKNAHYEVTPRRIVHALAQALANLQVPHPLHIHGSNLGVAGNAASTLKTIEAAEGLPIHLTHIQFHSYGNEGPRKFSSDAARIAEAINANPNVSCDVGQIMFGRTVTTSGDAMAQIRASGFGDPRRSVLMDIECDAGCGIVPFRYRDKSFVNALQWAIGLEIFLAVNDPWRIFLTTDHPNGAPFTSYPRLIKLLMDRSFRNDEFAKLPADVQAASNLASMTREYSMQEIATMTRAAPARILGLADRGHLAPGAAADVVVYRRDADPERMFTTPHRVFKDGVEVVRDGRITQIVRGNVHRVQPDYDRGIEKRIDKWFRDTQTLSMQSLVIGDDELCDCGPGAHLFTQPCKRRWFHT